MTSDVLFLGGHRGFTGFTFADFRGFATPSTTNSPIRNESFTIGSMIAEILATSTTCNHSHQKTRRHASPITTVNYSSCLWTGNSSYDNDRTLTFVRMNIYSRGCTACDFDTYDVFFQACDRSYTCTTVSWNEGFADLITLYCRLWTIYVRYKVDTNPKKLMIFSSTFTILKDTHFHPFNSVQHLKIHSCISSWQY